MFLSVAFGYVIYFFILRFFFLIIFVLFFSHDIYSSGYLRSSIYSFHYFNLPSFTFTLFFFFFYFHKLSLLSFKLLLVRRCFSVFFISFVFLPLLLRFLQMRVFVYISRVCFISCHFFFQRNLQCYFFTLFFPFSSVLFNFLFGGSFTFLPAIRFLLFLTPVLFLPISATQHFLSSS